MFRPPSAMILKRYGSTVQSVDTDFDSRALNEVGFRRNNALSIRTEEFEGGYRRTAGHELAPTAEGPVQDEAEQALLQELEDRLREIESGLEDGEVLLVESQQGIDYPKTRHLQKGVIVDGENRLYFYARIEPPLRVGVYRKEA